tara:strand:+ start:633 stop:1283 length:651 start_codon:yes stop_codon:yes gene_type:complete
MAYTSKDFQEDLAIFSAGAILGPTRTRKMLAFAARKGISLAGLGARAAAAPAARAITNPYIAGAALGGAALQTEPGQELLERAAQSGADTRRALDMALFEARYGGEPGGGYGIGTGYGDLRAVAPTVKRRASSFNKAVSAGMKAVKGSKFGGKKGTLTNAKRTFTQVTKTASKITKGKKVSAKGVIGTIARAVRPKLKKRSPSKTKMTIKVRGRDY